MKILFTGTRGKASISLNAVAAGRQAIIPVTTLKPCSSEYKYCVNKMKVLDLNLVLLKFLGLYTDETSIRLLQAIRFVFFLLGVTFSASVCGGIYLCYHFRELEMATNALIVLTAGVAGSTSFITFGMKLKEIKELYRTLQPIVNTGETLIFGKSRPSCVLLPSNERFHFLFGVKRSEWKRCFPLLSRRRAQKSPWHQISHGIHAGQHHFGRIHTRLHQCVASDFFLEESRCVRMVSTI